MASIRTAVFGPTAGMVSSRSRPACNSPWGRDMGGDGAPQGLAARLQRRKARQQGLLDDIGASAGAGLLKAIPLAPQVGLDVIQARDEALQIEQGPGRGKP